MSDSSLHSRHVPLGMTRDCLDPWTYVEFRTNGDISPCCVRPPVGNIAQTSLGVILNGPEVRMLRRRLLTGDLDAPCLSCGLRAAIGTEDLRDKVTQLLATVELPSGFSDTEYLAAHPDVAANGTQAARHYLTFGRFEGRPIR